MSNSTPDSNASSTTTLRKLASHAKLRASQAAANPTFRRAVQFSLTLFLFSGTAMAQTTIGDTYCGTSVEGLLDVTFGALVGLGLPATMFYVGRSGLSYMRASGNPNQQNEARKDLILSMTGFGVILLAIVSPELIDKFASAASVQFSDCVKPLS
ncbi:pilin [Halomicroarcula sp. F28]|uniref:Pilin n=2 Tax=Haloarcula salinisoli TaxID=2487746 RepID=A0A8J7YPQ5_9EURY|nr:pilin [Halomicroarcula salinisoli]MBX0305646.1 pilin [Halomicroarcula salinisoli]